jgi:hypothetical protein
MKRIYFITFLFSAVLYWLHIQQASNFKTYSSLLSIGRDFGKRRLVSEKFDLKMQNKWTCFENEKSIILDSSLNNINLDQNRLEFIGKILNEFTILNEDSELSEDSLCINLIILKKDPINVKFFLVKINNNWIIDDITGFESIFEYVQNYKNLYN